MSKKNKTITTIVAIIVLLLVCYAVWFFVPRPVIPKGAENFRLGMIGGDSRGYDQYIIVSGSDTSDWYKISEEGQQKLFEALQGKAMRAELPARSHYAYNRTEDNALQFSIQYSRKGGEYDMFIQFVDVFRMNKHGIGETTVSPLEPAGWFETRVVGITQNQELYAQIMDIIKTYGTIVPASK